MKKMIVMIAALIASPAFALFSPLPDSAVAPQQWQAIYTGETLVDGVRTVAMVEEATVQIEVPGQLIGNTVLPSALEKSGKAYRLTLVSVEQPNLRARLGLTRQVAFVDGQISKAFVSKENAQGFTFVIRSVGDGRLEATFTRDGEASIQQRFEMIPAVQVM